MNQEYRFLQSVQGLLDTRADACVRLVGEDKTNTVRETLREKVVILQKRQNIYALPRLSRARAIVSLWRDGGYRHSRGLSAIVKDALIRPNVSGRSEQ